MGDPGFLKEHSIHFIVIIINISLASILEMAALVKQIFYFKHFGLRQVANSYSNLASRSSHQFGTHVISGCHYRLKVNETAGNFSCLLYNKNSILRIGRQSFSLGSSLEKDSIPHPADYELDSLSLSRALLAQKNPQKVLYNDIIDEFPEGLQMVFAYGSGAFQQQNSKDKSKNMLDFIFVVEKPEHWHQMNLEKHPHHYSLLKRFGSHFITQIQEK